jgi:hypothetical protein
MVSEIVVPIQVVSYAKTPAVKVLPPTETVTLPVPARVGVRTTSAVDVALRTVAGLPLNETRSSARVVLNPEPPMET